MPEKIVKYLANFSKTKKKPLLVGGNGGKYTHKMSKLIENHKIPVYDDVVTLITAANALFLSGKNLWTRDFLHFFLKNMRRKISVGKQLTGPSLNSPKAKA